MAGTKKVFMVTPKVVEASRKHYGCNSLVGVQLEDQGQETSALTHWESRIMLGDYMISNDFEERAISDITLALFEDSGWYQVNYGLTGGLFRFGKNEGCSFVDEKCIIAEQTLHPKEYCIESKANRCMTSHTAKGYCFLLTGIENIPEQYQYFTDKTKGGFGFADFCPIIFPFTDFTKEYFGSNCQIGNKGIYPPGLGEVIGNNSICIESSLAKKGDSSVEDYKGKLIAKCHEVNCDYASNIFTVKVNDISFTCQKDGQLY